MAHIVADPGLPTQERSEGRKLRLKVYLVLLRNNVAREGQPNVQVIAVRLNHQAAQKIVDQTPGTFIQKHFATK